MKWLAQCLFVYLLTLVATSAWAHKPSDSYMSVKIRDKQLIGRWDIALRDLDTPMVLDARGDGQLTWGEVRAREDDIKRYAFNRLQLSAGGKPCQVTPGVMLIDHHSDGTYAVLPFTATCTIIPRQLEVDYRLFADIDTLHKGLIHVEKDGGTSTAIVGLDRPHMRIDTRGRSRWNSLLDFAGEGIWHIWRGFDHALFLICLILPAAYRVVGRRWQAVDTATPVVVDILKTVTGFTAAHAVSLTLATLGVINVPSQAIEIAIAITILLTAINNIYPVVAGRKWVAAFVFGLIHGFGFANVLADMALPVGQLAIALAGFNIGVEIGQLAIVVLLLPILFIYRRGDWFRRTMVYGGSLMIAVFSVIWIYERSTGIKILGL